MDRTLSLRAALAHRASLFSWCVLLRFIALVRGTVGQCNRRGHVECSWKARESPGSALDIQLAGPSGPQLLEIVLAGLLNPSLSFHCVGNGKRDLLLLGFSSGLGCYRGSHGRLGLRLRAGKTAKRLLASLGPAIAGRHLARAGYRGDWRLDTASGPVPHGSA